MLKNRLKLLFYISSLVLVSACGAAGEGGSEGPEGTGNEGGVEGGNEGGGTSTIPFVSTGISRGTFESISLAPDETFSGILSDTEVAVMYDPVLESFIGRVRNEAPAAVCDVRVAITLDGFQVVNMSFSGNPFVLPGLAQFGAATFEFPVAGVSFSDFTILTETSTCSSAPSPLANGGEGAEGGSESGNETGGSESGSESSPPIPINMPFSGTFQNQIFDFAYDALTGAFRGTVNNPTNAFICDSRTEIHTGVGTQVVELGPTIPVNLAPGETIKVVMSAGGFVLDTYSLHPEATPCP